MEIGLAVANQVAIMVIIIAIGFFCYKIKLLTDAGVKNMSDILLFVVTPCMLINAYQQDYTSDMAKKFLLSAGMALVLHLVMITVVTLIFRRERSEELRKINIFSSIYSNCGFMGLPLLSAALGTEGVFLGSAYLAVFSILYWTHGVFVFTGDKRSLIAKKAVLNPGVLGVIVGLILFFCRIKLPSLIGTTVSGIAALNTPMAMLVIGAFLAKTRLKTALKRINVWLVSGLRLLLLPLAALLILKLFHIPSLVGMAILLQISCPCATVSSLFAVRYGYDPTYASEVISISTVLSLLTIPLIAFLGAWL